MNTKPPLTVTGRERLNLDADWRFHLGELPHAMRRIPVKGWVGQSAGNENPLRDEKKLGIKALGDKGDWYPVGYGEDLFNLKPGFFWVKVDLPDVPGPHRFLHFESVDDNVTVWVNGQKLLYHEGWNDCFDVSLDSVWHEGGPHQVVLLIENLPVGIFLGGGIKQVDLCSRTDEVSPAVDPGFKDDAWRSVHLPHDFVVEGTVDPQSEVYHGFLPRNSAWYRKTFDLPASDKGRSLWIEFDGVYRNSQVWLNGQFLGSHLSGYTGFRWNISSVARYGGKNHLVVYVDARSGEGWWYEGGGIYRHVWLMKADLLHVAPEGTYVISTPQGSPDHPSSAHLEIQTTVVNQSHEPLDFKIHSEIQTHEGQTVLSITGSYQIEKEATLVITQKESLKDPRLWSLENPHLYRLVTRLEKEGQEVDRVQTSFGIRTIYFDPDHGFFLNGQSVKIKGTCNHQDFPGVGIAMPDRLFTYRLEKLKEMGSNAYRCSHNPPAIELLEECDRMGFLVVEENRKLGDSDEILSQVAGMVIRDRNHPSIILWSLCNEEPKQGTEEGRRMGEAMKKNVLQYDRTRLVTCAMNLGWGLGLSQVVDVQGFNYNISQYDSFHQSHPNMPLLGSETASTVSTRGIYQNDLSKGYLSAYDLNYPEWALPAEQAWKPIAEKPFMSGCFIWTGFDYKGEPTPYSWPCVNSHFGIFDTCGFAKDNYYYYQSWWSSQTVLHLLPHWNWQGQEGQEIEVWCHSNCDQVELFLNGKSLGSQKMQPHGHLEWKVKYQPGVLKAVGMKKGVKAAEKIVETTLAPFQIHLDPYQVQMKADGEDVLPVVVSIQDSVGRLVPVADNEITFNVVGPARIAGVGNGDPSSHESDKAHQRKAFNGHCMVILQSRGDTGKIKLTAASPGLKRAELDLSAISEWKND